VLWLETPRNPDCEVADIRAYVAAARAIGGVRVVVDSTFAPPPVQRPLTLGADVVMCASWPLQDILSLQGLFARINLPFITPHHLHCPHRCNTVARLLHNLRPPPDPPFVCHTPYTIGIGNIV